MEQNPISCGMESLPATRQHSRQAGVATETPLSRRTVPTVQVFGRRFQTIGDITEETAANKSAS